MNKQVTNPVNLTAEEFMHPGNRACSGCGLSTLYRIGLKALGRDSIFVVPPSCLTVMQGLYPIAATQIPCLNVTFASTAAAASGVRAALKVRKKENTKVVAWAGDGGTSDIGIQSLSAAIERGEDFLYICYDNEAYMNTGVQRSGTTPQGTITTNTPIKGKIQKNKDLPKIIAAHNPTYVATCSAAYPLDFYNKIIKAISLKGMKYIHIHTPCPSGWGIAERLSITVGKMAVNAGLYDLYEVENGKKTLSGPSSKLLQKKELPRVAEYLKIQSRFRALSEQQIAEIQAEIDTKWEGYRQEVG
ncbi:MAG: pyruvate synthase subunit beta [Deltaproteobacteria bacterium]|nr:pyruvate synthase subunit beta [Deltaproteobacteria bacterium]MBT4267671.1 pyruvate synthase subunit beta [Deltaproteobacteria bacterium]MBT4642411.1 pyruvate synthase subunit beta [Deltaproteobacteria bacterium]MBT6611200.1 pyruvate synthase subunit beta [Deltaproteobacteria bacterium]MBT7151663.1 pyruvate synthase subunit beta [Deltaproteobacteria bacterium]